jgi:hypothetical protein
MVNAETDQGFAKASFLSAGGTRQTPDTLLPETNRETINSQAIAADSLRISIEELRQLWQRNIPVVLLDVRSERHCRANTVQARGAVRVSPDRAAGEAATIGLSHSAWLVAYCA